MPTTGTGFGLSATVTFGQQRLEHPIGVDADRPCRGQAVAALGGIVGELVGVERHAGTLELDHRWGAGSHRRAA